MKGKDLVTLIQDGRLEEFDLKFSFFEDKKSQQWVGYRNFINIEIADIGYSEKEIILEGEEK